MLDWSRVKTTPFKHQYEDAEVVVNSPFILIASEMRTGKTKIVIDAIQFLYEKGVINRALIIPPAPVRGEWYDPEFGQLNAHLWDSTPAKIIEWHSNPRAWYHGPRSTSPLEIYATNYEFLRRTQNLMPLLPICGPKTIIIGDESSFLKNDKSQQTKAFYTLRWHCGRVILLNGTPITHSPFDMFSQGNILHPRILECKYITHYKARYAILTPVLSNNGKALKDPKGNVIMEVDKWVNLDDLQRRFAPYVIRRLQKDCLDLPEKLPPVILTAQLDQKTWTIYKQMRDDAVVEFEGLGNTSISATAATKAMRLSQITSGFLGGIENYEPIEVDDDKPEWMTDKNPLRAELPQVEGSTREIGREKLDVLLWFLKHKLEENENFRTVVWCRFRPELFRMMKEISGFVHIGSLYGGQKKAEREATKRLLHPDTTPKNGSIFVGGTYGTGSFGLNFTAANTSITCSFDYSGGKYLQSKDRVYGPGQKVAPAYFDIIATGPKGQKTIDHAILKARNDSVNLATWVASDWVKALRAE